MMKIVITLPDGHDAKLSLDEARKLLAELNSILGERDHQRSVVPVIPPYYPPQPMPYPYVQTWPNTWHEITCGVAAGEAQ